VVEVEVFTGRFLAGLLAQVVQAVAVAAITAAALVPMEQPIQAGEVVVVGIQPTRQVTNTDMRAVPALQLFGMQIHMRPHQIQPVHPM
jgi:hypothetical protein